MAGGYQQHRNSIHIEPPCPTRPRQHPFVHDEEIPQGAYYTQHPVLDGSPCDAEGHDLLPQQPPADEPRDPADDTWKPFPSRGHFELADFLFWRNQMPAAQVDDLMQVLTSFEANRGSLPFNGDAHLHDSIDSIPHNVPWQSLTLRHPDYEMNLDNLDIPPWKCAEFDVWLRDPRELVKNQLSNPVFADSIDYAPRQVFNKHGQRVWTDFMTGNWSWNQCNTLADDGNCHGAMFIPIILGSDKTTVSVATAHQDLINYAVLAEQGHEDSKEYLHFRRHLFHASLRAILESFRPAMQKPEIVKCADGHYRHAVYGLGPYIADYPEQSLGTADRKNLDGSQCNRRSHAHTHTLMLGYSTQELRFGWGIIDGILPFTAYFLRADIHELLAPDILHQIIEGTFKDHLVHWVDEYLVLTYGEAHAEAIWADIDRRIAAGRKFKQWTGDDSKALMKVFLPAIAGHIPDKMVRAISAFLDFCYIVHHSSLDEGDLLALDEALLRFHEERSIFVETGVKPDGISLPRQHSLCHYRYLIQQFGAPNGLCSSLTESKHQKAVKEPWRRSSGNLALGQMLEINQHLDKLALFQAEKFAAGLLDTPLLPSDTIAVDPDNIGGDPDEENYVIADDQDAEIIVQLAKNQALHYPSRLQRIGEQIGVPHLRDLVRQFLHDQRNPDHPIPGHEMDVSLCPDFNGKVHIFHSAVASFYAPSDICGVNGMLRHVIRSAPTWHNGPACHDCVFIEHDSTLPGFQGLYVAQVILFFSFHFRGVDYPCALVRWFETIGDQPCPNTGMWMVEPEFDANGQRLTSVVHLDTILRPAHLIPVYGNHFIDHDIKCTDSLIAFAAFYINKFSDYHAFEIAF
ncbi:hypothetical protein DFJ58DRAFT_718262 [Suillus subalutaceus]|uniref:uncharacterized protein n=1 Tax=Suillus subalutaceus TaxID=48586 RepID=UPI001B8826B2|nr:uncharacterized protein DFJ58DRAFT_718262 [Suillus subalutaceus]KAG1840904.1 hypothetical protein DFJ58DRAFT_718262 [Suillus subalutaceus]